MNSEQEQICEALNCEWSDVELQFCGQSIEQIKAELDKMFWSDTDINGKLAQEIFNELEYQKS